MRKKLILIVALASIAVISAPAVLAILQQSQTIHVSRTYESTLPPVSNDEVAFSLYFVNGSAYVINQDHCGSIWGAQTLDVNGIPCCPQTELGAPATGYPQGVIVVHNDGNVPIKMSAALTNVVKPSDIDIVMTYGRCNPALWGTQLNGWLGYNNYASSDTVQPGQYIWLSVCVIMFCNTNPTGVLLHHEAFDYDFDVEITATQA